MDFDQLKGFYYTAKLRSFTAAAKKLFLTQPAISLKIKALETAVGEKLLERVRRTIRLTPAGEILFRHAEEIVGKLDEIDRVVLDIKGLGKGRLAIGASDTTSIYFLPDLLKAFRTTHPNIELEIRSLFSAGVVEKVLDREVDLGVVTLPQAVKSLLVEPLFSQRLVCIASREHRFAEFSAVRLSELMQEPLVLLARESQTRQMLDASFARFSRKPRVALELSSFEIIKHYVAAGLGVSIIPEKAADPLIPGLCCIPLRRRMTVDVGVVYRRDRLLSHPATVFLNMAREHFQGGERGDGSCLVPVDVAGPVRN
ncbi:MAG: LysR family transcriptional regulator [Planctomycetes bacterium]|nr:LysR family transcriptional regulator [Planctomycetota bacterium]